MVKRDYRKVVKDDFLTAWDEITTFRKPIIAAVNGLAVSRERAEEIIPITRFNLSVAYLYLESSPLVFFLQILFVISKRFRGKVHL